MILSEVLFEELSPAPSEWSNLVNLAVGAMSAAAQVGVEQGGQSCSVHSACFEDHCMNDLLP